MLGGLVVGDASAGADATEQPAACVLGFRVYPMTHYRNRKRKRSKLFGMLDRPLLCRPCYHRDVTGHGLAQTTGGWTRGNWKIDRICSQPAAGNSTFLSCCPAGLPDTTACIPPRREVALWPLCMASRADIACIVLCSLSTCGARGEEATQAFPSVDTPRSPRHRGVVLPLQPLREAWLPCTLISQPLYKLNILRSRTRLDADSWMSKKGSIHDSAHCFSGCIVIPAGSGQPVSNAWHLREWHVRAKLRMVHGHNPSRRPCSRTKDDRHF